MVVWNLERASSSSQTAFCEALILFMGSNSFFLGPSPAVLLKHADHWGILLKCVFDSVDQGVELRFCISTRFPGDAETVNQ